MDIRQNKTIGALGMGNLASSTKTCRGHEGLAGMYTRPSHRVVVIIYSFGNGEIPPGFGGRKIYPVRAAGGIIE